MVEDAGRVQVVGRQDLAKKRLNSAKNENVRLQRCCHIRYPGCTICHPDFVGWCLLKMARMFPELVRPGERGRHTAPRVPFGSGREGISPDENDRDTLLCGSRSDERRSLALR